MPGQFKPVMDPPNCRYADSRPASGHRDLVLVLVRHGGNILSHSRVGIVAIAGSVGTVNGIPAGTARYGREDPHGS